SASEIDSNDALKFFEGQLFHCPVTDDSGVVHEHIEPAEALFDLIHHQFHLIRLGYIAINHQGIAQFGRYLFRVGLVCSCEIADEVDYTSCAARAEGFDHCGPEAARTAGDKNNLVGKIEWVRHELTGLTGFTGLQMAD